MSLTILTGGVRSGKSQAAQLMFLDDDRPVSVITPAMPGPRVSEERIAWCRANRPPNWHTLEIPVDLVGAVKKVPDDHLLIIDCVTSWFWNALDARQNYAEILRTAHNAASLVGTRERPTVAITTEVGSGNPANSEVRRQAKQISDINRVWADKADDVLLVASGRLFAGVRPEDWFARRASI